MSGQRTPAREGTKRRARLWAIGGVVLAIVGMFAATGALSALSFPGHAAAVPGDPTFTCPSDTALTVSLVNPPASYGPHSVLSLSWKVVNDEDSGFAGYWALDSYTVVLHVWLLKAGPYAGQYYFWKTYRGLFQTPQGALSPGETGTTPNAIPEPASGFGTMVGGYFGFLAGGTFYPAAGPTSGNLGTINLQGTTADLLLDGIGQVGDLASFDWYAVYFHSSGTFSYGDSGNGWGWVYTLNNYFRSTTSSNQWCNFGTGSSGDIVTAA